jgi:hypothetical protein
MLLSSVTNAKYTPVTGTSLFSLLNMKWIPGQAR